MDKFKRIFVFVLIAMVLICGAGAERLGASFEAGEAIIDMDDPYKDDVLITDGLDEEGPIGALEEVWEAPDIFNLLLIGTDGYSSKINGRSDSMMLVRLNKQTKQIQIVSFMRDLFVKIPGKGKTRLNAAFVYGGAELLEKTLFENFGVSADGYLAVNFAIMKDLVNEIGGITVTVTKAEMNQINVWMKDYYKQSGKKANYQKLTEYGDVHLDGDSALAFSRIRNIDSDYERTRRQRQVIEAVFKKVMTMDKLTIAGLVLKNIGKVQTDLGLDDALKLAPIVSEVADWQITTVRIPAQNCYTSETISGMAVLVPNLQKNKAALEAFFSGQ